MLEMLLDKKLLFVLMGILTGLGVVDKCIVSMTMKRMVEAAGSMSKSNHPLMRLVRAKFEHACMISDTVENVGVFVDKYLYEYKVCGLRLHTLRRLEKICVGLLIVTGLVGAGLSYQVYGMGDAVLRMGACGAGLGILVWLFHLTTDENYCMQMAKNYMVDYLENVCLHKYEKANQKERTGRRDSVIKKDETNDTKEEKAEPEQPKMTRLASKYPKLFKVNKELEDQNGAIQQKQKQLSAKKKELSEVTGWFKGRKKKELQEEIDDLTSQIRNMKDYLPKSVQKVGYRNVQEFLKDFQTAKSEYRQYQKAIAQWKQETGKEPEPQPHGVRAKLAANRKKIEQERKIKA